MYANVEKYMYRKHKVKKPALKLEWGEKITKTVSSQAKWRADDNIGKRWNMKSNNKHLQST